MSQTPSQFLEALLQNITDFYTAQYSTDTDLYELLRMYSRGLSSGSVALDTVRENAFIKLCESSQLFNNFGTFFGAHKVTDQGDFDDRYLISSGSVTRTAPPVYEDVTSIDIAGDQANTTTGEWPYNLRINPDSAFEKPGKGMTDGVLWSGSLYSTCFADILDSPLSSTYTLLVTSTLGTELGAITYSSPNADETFSDVSVVPVEGFIDSAWRTYLQGEEQAAAILSNRQNAPFALTTYKKYLGDGKYSELPEHEYMFFCRIRETSLVASGTALYPAPSTDRMYIYKVSPATSHTSSFLNEAVLSPSAASITRNTFFVVASDNDSTTRAVELNGKIYFGMAIDESPAWSFNGARGSEEGYALFPKWVKDADKRYPHLFSFDTTTDTLDEVGLAAYASSGSLSYGAEDHWRMGAIAAHSNRIYMTLVNDAGTKHKMMSYLDADPATTPGLYSQGFPSGSFAFDLTPPSGSAIDMLEYRGDLYALANDLVPTNYKIAKFRHGLETLSDTIGHWRFDRNIVNEGTDSAIAEFNVSPGATFAGFTFGKTSKDVTSFDASGTTLTGVKIPAATASGFDMASTDFTVEVILKVPSTFSSTSNTGILNKFDGASGWSLYMDPTGLPVFYIDDGGTINSATATTRNLNDGAWHLLTLVCDRSGTGNLHGYVDGYEVGSVSITAGNIDAAAADLELMYSTTNPGFDGVIDEICITRARAQSAAEVLNRNYQINHMGGYWLTQKILSGIPFQKLHEHEGRLFASAGSKDLPPWTGYLNTDTNRWDTLDLKVGRAIDSAALAADLTREEITNVVKGLKNTSTHTGPDTRTLDSKKGGGTEQDELLLRDLGTQPTVPSTEYVRDFVSSGSALLAMTGGSWEKIDGLFTSETWRYVYPGSVATASFTQFTSIPGYRKQLDFLMDAAVHGSSVSGMDRAVQGFTLIKPDIKETAVIPGWKLKSYEGPVAQISENTWKFNDHHIRGLSATSETVGLWKFNGDLKATAGRNFEVTSGELNNFVNGYVELSGSSTAISFDANNFIGIDSTVATDFDMGTTDFTIEMLVKVDTSIASTNGLYKKDGALGDGWRVLYKGTTTGWRMEVDDGGGGGTLLNDQDASVPDDTWQYVVYVVDRTAATITNYTNAVAGATVTDISTVPGNISNSTIDFSINPSETGLVFDELCVTRRALSAEEITLRWKTIQTGRHILRSGTPLRSNLWKNSLATFYSGSTPQNKLVANYVTTAPAFGSSEVTVAPIADDNLLWDLRRIEE